MSFNAEIWDKTLLAESTKPTQKSGKDHSTLAVNNSNHSDASSEISSDEEISIPKPKSESKFGFGSLKRRGPSPSSLSNGNHGESSHKSTKPGSTGVWYKIFHHGEEDHSSDSNLSSSPGSPSLKPKNFAWGKSKRTVDSDDEYHSDDSHASSSSVFSMKLPPSAVSGSANAHEKSSSSHHINNNHAKPPKPSSHAIQQSQAHPKKQEKRSVHSLFHPKVEDSSDNDSSTEAPPRRPSTNIFKDLFWRSSSSVNHDSHSGSDVHPSSTSHTTVHTSTHPSTRMSTNGLSSSPSNATQEYESKSLSKASFPSLSHPNPNHNPNHHIDSHSNNNSHNSIPTLSRNLSETSLSDKYGRKENVLGRGATATVRLCCPMNSKKRFAIKEFRKRRKDEGQKEYVKKLIAEFCISSSLEHPNVVKTIDLIQDERHSWCVVMEYCEGGDLFTRIISGLVSNAEEYNCYFKQLILGVQYLHSMGVAHRDLKPENLLLDKEAKILKITDFGVSEVFRDPFHSGSKKAHGLCGSGPYIAPEEFDQEEYDSESVDIWAIGIIYFTMANTSCPWKSAVPTDPRYHKYVESKSNYYPIERLAPGQRNMLYRILDPNPKSRITLKGLLEDEYIKSIHVCYEKGYENGHLHLT